MVQKPVSGPGPHRGFTIKLRHAMLGGTALDEWSARRREYLTKQHKRQASMSLVGFEPEIPASEWPQIYVLDRTATSFGQFLVHYSYKCGLTLRSVCRVLLWIAQCYRKGAQIFHKSMIRFKMPGTKNGHEVSWVPANIRRHRTNFGRTGDLAHGICAPLMLHNIRKSTNSFRSCC
jgi:hypothetical protein